MQRVPRILVTLTLGLLVAVAAGAEKTSQALEVGSKAPKFKLIGTDGEKHALGEYLEENEVTAIVFTCNSCPFSQAYEPVLLDLAKQYAKKPVSFVLINSNAVEVKPTDSYEHMVKLAKEKKYPFDYLHDESQEIAHAYGAQRTPEVFLLDSKGVCRYAGRINDNAKPEKVKAHDLSNAIDAILAGEDVPVSMTKAFGCTIKWKKQSS